MIAIPLIGCLMAHPLPDGRVVIGQYVNMGEIYVPPSHVFVVNTPRPVVCRSGSGWILYVPRR